LRVYFGRTSRQQGQRGRHYSTTGQFPYQQHQFLGKGTDKERDGVAKERLEQCDARNGWPAAQPLCRVGRWFLYTQHVQPTLVRGTGQRFRVRLTRVT